MKIMSRALVVAISLLAALPCIVHAASGSVTCSVLNTTLTFNPYDPMLAGADDDLPTGTVTVQCSSTSNSLIALTYNLTLAIAPARSMVSGGNNLTYDLYTDSARSAQWNTTNLVSCNFILPKNGANQQNSCSFYGRIPRAQDVAAGTYTQSGLAIGGTFTCNPVPTGGC